MKIILLAEKVIKLDIYNHLRYMTKTVNSINTNKICEKWTDSI